MKLQVSEDKSVDFKKTSKISYTLGLVEECIFGKNYLVIDVIEDEKISNLLRKYEDEKIIFNLFNDVLFVNFLDDDLYFYANFPDNYIEFLKENNQIVFVIKDNNVEYFMLYDKIFK